LSSSRRSLARPFKPLPIRGLWDSLIFDPRALAPRPSRFEFSLSFSLEVHFFYPISVPPSAILLRRRPEPSLLFFEVAVADERIRSSTLLAPFFVTSRLSRPSSLASSVFAPLSVYLVAFVSAESRRVRPPLIALDPPSVPLICRVF